MVQNTYMIKIFLIILDRLLLIVGDNIFYNCWWPIPHVVLVTNLGLKQDLQLQV